MSSIEPGAGPVNLAEEKHGFFALRVLDTIDEDDGDVLRETWARPAPTAQPRHGLTVPSGSAHTRSGSR